METVGFSSPFFNDEDEARTYLEMIRWPEGIVCPHCGNKDGHYPLQPKADSKSLSEKACGNVDLAESSLVLQSGPSLKKAIFLYINGYAPLI